MNNADGRATKPKRRTSKLWGKVSSFVTTKFRKKEGSSNGENVTRRTVGANLQNVAGKPSVSNKKNSRSASLTGVPLTQGLFKPPSAPQRPGDFKSLRVVTNQDNVAFATPLSLHISNQRQYSPKGGRLSPVALSLPRKNEELLKLVNKFVPNQLDNSDDRTEKLSNEEMFDMLKNHCSTLLKQQERTLLGWELLHADGELDPIDVFIDNIGHVDSQMESIEKALNPILDRLVAAENASYHRSLEKSVFQKENEKLLIRCLEDILDATDLSTETSNLVMDNKRLENFFFYDKSFVEKQNGESSGKTCYDVESKVIPATNEVLSKIENIKNKVGMLDIAAVSQSLKAFEACTGNILRLAQSLKHKNNERVVACSNEGVEAEYPDTPNLNLLLDMLGVKQEHDL